MCAFMERELGHLAPPQQEVIKEETYRESEHISSLLSPVVNYEMIFGILLICFA